MDVRTPALVLLCALLAALALSVLGLAADNVAYVNNHHDDTVNLHYLRWNQTAEATYSYWVQIDYLPSRFSMTRINAMLGASVITALAAIAAAVISWRARGEMAAKAEVTLKNKKYSASLLPIALTLAIITFIISFAVAVYAWYPVMKWSIDLKKSLPLPPSVTGAKSKTVQYQSPFDFVPDVWNCLVSDYAVEPAVAGRLHALCREASIAKTLMLPVVVLSAALAVVLGFSWWKAGRNVEVKTETKETDAEMASI